jgi:hypothetical protein
MSTTNPGIYPGTTGRTRMPNTLGELSILRLIESAESEVKGLAELVRAHHPECSKSPDMLEVEADFERLFTAYVGSIRTRLIVAKGKIA